MKGAKQQVFSKQFKSLGVELDLRDFCRAEARIGHTSERREEIGAVLDAILRASCVTAKQAVSPRAVCTGLNLLLLAVLPMELRKLWVICRCRS